MKPRPPETSAPAPSRSRRRSAPRAQPPRPGSQTFAELRELQRQAMGVIRFPLSRAGRTQSQWSDGRPMREYVSEFIKPNDRLTSLERLEIYNRQYWFRLMDCLYDDFPGLRSVLGERQFRRLRVAYLDRYPSRSFTLRNLGSRLAQFLVERPELSAPANDLCLDLARFEWAQILAFDEAELPTLAADAFAGLDPASLRIGLQPYLTLLELDYELDDYVLAVKKRERSMASRANSAVAADAPVSRPPRRVRPPKKARTWLAVHRHDTDLYYRRLAQEEYMILTALRSGKTLGRACGAAVRSYLARGLDPAGEVQRAFASWAELGWLSAPPK